jgi:hypothetical protein
MVIVNSVQNWIKSQKIWHKRFSFKYHQLHCTIYATIVLVFMLWINLVYLLAMYQYIKKIIIIMQ